MPAQKAQTRATAGGSSDATVKASKRKAAAGAGSDTAAASAKRKAKSNDRPKSDAKTSKRNAIGAGKSEARRRAAKRKASISNKSPAVKGQQNPAATPSDGKSATKVAKQARKPVRDSFTMPAADFALIARLKARTLEARRETKKSELLRAGLHALEGLDLSALVHALDRLTPIKVGRPSKRH